MGQTERCGRHVKSCACLALILLFCLGCTTSGPVGTRTEKSPKPTIQQGLSTKADRLLNVQVQEQPAEVLIRLTANGPFQDYRFNKLSEDQFEVNLGDITDKANLPVLPVSQKMQLSYGDSLTPQGVRLAGSLNGHLDRYIMNTAGNDLVLALYLSPPSVSAAAAPRRTEYRVHPKVAKRRPPAPRPGIDNTQGASTDIVDKMPGAEADLAGTTLLKSRYTGKPISLDLIDADLKNVLRLLADISGTNIAVEPDVTGKVTLKVEQVPWDQVLDMVLTMNDLGKVQVGGVIRIAKQEALKKEWDQQKDTLKAKQDFVEAAKDLGGISTAYLTVNYAPAGDIATKIKEIMSDKGKVSVDDRTSLIIYTDYDSRVENARRLLGRLDRATPQVLIEARIVTVSTDLSRNLGVRWSFQASHVAGSRYSTPSDLIQGISGGPTNIDPFTQAFQVNQGVSNLFNFAFGQLVGKTLMEVDLEISALEQTQDLKIMASPKVLTLNNVKAVISQGTQIPYAQFNEFGTAVGTQFVNAVLELAVTPHITPDRKVRMLINAKQDEPSATIVGAQGQPGIDTRKIDTELLVDDGSVIVIGGVIRNRETATRRATPGVHKIPILGRLFKSDDETSNKTELLIFISPKIVDASRMPERG